MPLTPENPALVSWSLDDILINTRGAADAVGATMMDRSEWIDTFPESLTAIATLTNNNRRVGFGNNQVLIPARRQTCRVAVTCATTRPPRRPTARGPTVMPVAVRARRAW